MYYRFKTAFIFNYEIDSFLNSILNQCLKSGLKSVNSESSFYATIIFNNGIKFTYWNVNRYYAWLKKGVFEFPDGNTYNYDDARPSAKTMYKMRRALENFNCNY
jgi:hypothetical protein